MTKSKQRATTANSGIDFSMASEGALLAFCVGLYGLSHPKESGKTAFAQAIKKTEPFIDKCVEDVAHLGYVDWQIIQGFLPIKVFDVWAAYQREQLTLQFK